METKLVLNIWLMSANYNLIAYINLRIEERCALFDV